MKPINYQITNTIVSNIVEIEKNYVRIESKKIDDGTKYKLRQEGLIENIFYFSNQVGINTTLASVKKFAEGTLDISDDDEKLVMLKNYRNALDYINSNIANNFVHFNTDLVSHFNKLLIQGIHEDWEAKPRTSSEIRPEYDDLLVYLDNSVTSAMVGSELTNTYNWYHGNQSIHFSIRVAVVYFRLMRIAPYKQFNKITNILTLQYLLNKEGYTFEGALGIIKLFNDNAKDYNEVWEACINSTSGNITPWIERLTFDLSKEIKLLLDKVSKLNTKNDKSSTKPFLDLNSRQVRVIKYLQTIPSLKREDYVKMFEVSSMTAYRDLTALLDKKILKIEGRGRATKYFLVSR